MNEIEFPAVFTLEDFWLVEAAIENDSEALEAFDAAFIRGGCGGILDTTINDQRERRVKRARRNGAI